MITSAGIPVLNRGVHPLPFFGPKGEWLLVAVDSKGQEVARGSIAKGQDPFPVNERLWSKLYRADPQ